MKTSRLWWSALAAAPLAAGCGSPRVEPLEAPQTAAAEQSDPALAVDPESGDLLLAWLAGDTLRSGIWFSRSRDAGGSWSAPVQVVPPSGDVQPHAEASPKLVAMPGGVVAIVWATSRAVAGRMWPAADVRVARSLDGGATWSAALTLNDDTAAAPIGHTFHGAAWQGDSGLVVAWLDERRTGGPPPPAGHTAHQNGESGDDNATLYLASSRDRGATWAPANRRLWGDVCPCCRVSLARGPGGSVQAVWRRVYPGNVRDVVVAALDQPGPTRVHADGWSLAACPDTGPGISIEASGVTHVVWFTGKEGAAGVYYARRESGSTGFSPPLALVGGRTMATTHATVAARAAGGAYIALDITSSGKRVPQLVIVDAERVVHDRVVLSNDAGADHPQVVGVPGGAVVAWTTTGARPSVRLARVSERAD